MKKKLALIILLFGASLFQSVMAQEDKPVTVTITASGSGATLDKAKQSGLRSAIEMAFGTFISSKTEILNDSLISDEITSVTSGNIQSYEMLNEAQLPDGSWGITLKAVVSIGKLTSFAQAKGITIEIKGGVFAANIKQQLLNEQGEIEAVYKMIELLHEPMQMACDYMIKSGEPKAIDTDSKNWAIPLLVTATANSNIDFCAIYLIKTLSALSLSNEDVTNYQSLNKVVYPVKISYKGNSSTYYLRRIQSIYALNTFTRLWEFYTRSFIVSSGIDQTVGNGKGEIQEMDEENKYYSPAGRLEQKKVNSGKGYIQEMDDGWTPNMKTIILLTAGNNAAKYTWEEKRTLQQIEQISSYSIKPTGVRSQIKHGGFVVYEKDGHGLVAALGDQGEYAWEEAKNICNDLILNEYSDWYLPNQDEMNLLCNNLFLTGIGGFGSGLYWCNKPNYTCCAFAIDLSIHGCGSTGFKKAIYLNNSTDFNKNFDKCYQSSYNTDINSKNYVRAVRVF